MEKRTRWIVLLLAFFVSSVHSQPPGGPGTGTGTRPSNPGSQPPNPASQPPSSVSSTMPQSPAGTSAGSTTETQTAFSTVTATDLDIGSGTMSTEPPKTTETSSLYPDLSTTEQSSNRPTGTPPSRPAGPSEGTNSLSSTPTLTGTAPAMMTRPAAVSGSMPGNTLASMPSSDMPEMPPPGQFASMGDSYLINTSKHCRMDTEAGRGGAIIGGLFQGHDSYNSKLDQCGGFLDWGAVESSLSFTFAFDKLVEEDILNWYTVGKQGSSATTQFLVGSYVRDTCTSSLMGVAQAQTLAQNSSVIESYATDVSTAYLTSAGLPQPASILDSCKPPLLMVIGPGSSEETASVSPILSVLKIPHISFWATSPQFNDLADYPYLFRAVPSDDHQVKALADIIEFFGWKYVGLIGGSDEIYSGRGMELLEEEQKLRKTFCIAYESRFSRRNTKVMEELAQQIAENREARVVVMFSTYSAAKEMLRTFVSENVTGKIIIGSDDWINRLGADYSLVRGNSVIGLSPEVIRGGRARRWVQSLWNEMNKYRNDMSVFARVIKTNPWFKPYYELAMKCRLPPRFTASCDVPLGAEREEERRRYPECDIEKLNWTPPAPQRTEAVMHSVELAGRAVLEAVYRQTEYNINADNNLCQYPRGDAILKQMKSLKIPCDEPGGECLAFNEFQSGWPIYTIRNWNHESDRLEEVGTWDGRQGEDYATRLWWYNSSTVAFWRQDRWSYAQDPNATTTPTSSCSRTCLPGERRFFHNLDAALCCWRCLPCEARSVSNTENADSCMTCALGSLPDAGQTACVAIQADTIEFTNGWAVSVAIVAILGGIIGIATLGTFWRFRTSYLVRASDLYLSSLILVGITMAQFLVLPQLTKPTNVTCRLPLLITAPWPILTSAGILVKTNRFSRIFAATTRLRSRSRSKRMLLSTPFQMGVVGFFTLIGVILGLVYLLVDPPTPTKTYPDTTTVYLVCSSSNVFLAVTLAYHLLLLMTCCVLAFQTRKLPDNYNEAKLVAMAAFTTCIVWLGFSPAVFITDSFLRPVILSIATIVEMQALWVCLYVPRLFPILTKKEARMSSIQRPTLANMPSNVRMVSLGGASSQFSTSTTGVKFSTSSPPGTPARSLTPASLSNIPMYSTDKSEEKIRPPEMNADNSTVIENGPEPPSPSSANSLI